LINLETLKQKLFIKCDLVIVFGTKFLKGSTLELLMDIDSLNIHAGVAPFYRGSDCNFWAQKDGNFGLVGVTLHKLSQNIDQGTILRQFLPTHARFEGFEFSMWVLFRSLQEITKLLITETKSSFKFRDHDPSNEIRYSLKSDFNSLTTNTFMKNTPKFEQINSSIKRRHNDNALVLESLILFD